MNPLAAAFSHILLGTTALLAQEPSPCGAIAAMFSVPSKFSNGIPIGALQIIATSGEVVSHKGFVRVP